MHSFFYYFGIWSFSVLAMSSVVLAYKIFKEPFLDLKRRYNDYCYLSNMDWSTKDFDNFMKNERKNMTDDEAKKWHKEHVHFWTSWICFKPMKKAD